MRYSMRRQHWRWRAWRCWCIRDVGLMPTDHVFCEVDVPEALISRWVFTGEAALAKIESPVLSREFGDAWFRRTVRQSSREPFPAFWRSEIHEEIGQIKMEAAHKPRASALWCACVGRTTAIPVRSEANHGRRVTAGARADWSPTHIQVRRTRSTVRTLPRSTTRLAKSAPRSCSRLALRVLVRPALPCASP